MFLAPTIVFNLYFLGASDGIIDSRTINSLMTCMQRFNQNTSLVIKSLITVTLTDSMDRSTNRARRNSSSPQLPCPMQYLFVTVFSYIAGSSKNWMSTTTESSISANVNSARMVEKSSRGKGASLHVRTLESNISAFCLARLDTIL